MVKKYRSTRYTKKKRLKYLVVGLILVFIVLVAVSAYKDYPQLEPVRMQMESFKSEIGTSELSVGETGMCDDLAITLVKGELIEGYTGSYISGYLWTEVPDGALLLGVYMKVENIGKIKKDFPHDIHLYYMDADMPRCHNFVDFTNKQYIPKEDYSNEYIGSRDKYPGTFSEGWIFFEVPVGIELDETTLKIRDLVWTLEEEKIEKITTIPLIR